MVIATLALAGVFLATYLTLFKLGYIGTLTCGTGECERVQTSRWAIFLGQPVALWGVGFYLAMLATSVAGSFGDLIESRAVSLVLVAMSGWGVLFSGWLTWLEIARIDAICRYCVASAVLVLVLFVVSLLDLLDRRIKAASATPVAGASSGPTRPRA
jgi:uncharacterized membrane protein